MQWRNDTTLPCRNQRLPWASRSHPDLVQAVPPLLRDMIFEAQLLRLILICAQQVLISAWHVPSAPSRATETHCGARCRGARRDQLRDRGRRGWLPRPSRPCADWRSFYRWPRRRKHQSGRPLGSRWLSRRSFTNASALQPATALTPATCAKGTRCTVPGLTPNLAAALRTDRPPLRASRMAVPVMMMSPPPPARGRGN